MLFRCSDADQTEVVFFFFQAEDGIRDIGVTGVQTCALPILIRNKKAQDPDAEIKVLNLFAYTGGATLAAAKAGAHVTHVDASKGMVTWAKENALASGLGDAPIRWLVDDCTKFVEREIRRGNHYDAVIMDPPSYGRGP